MTLQVQVLLNRMGLLGVSQAALCALTGLRPNELSPMFRGTRYLDNVSFAKIDHALAELEQLVKKARPFTIDFSDIPTTKFLLEKQRERDLDAYPSERSKELILELETFEQQLSARGF
jgi:hypothetical protein